jgi:peptide deformylase
MLEVIEHPNPVLLARAELIMSFDLSTCQLVEEMALAMYSSGGVGLAAPQVGHSRRVVLIDPTGGDDTNSLVAMINPVVTWVSDQKVVGEEGCLSLPGIRLQVPRAVAVTVEYHDVMGNLKRLECRDEYTARIIQHEVDHLDGVMMLDRVGPFARKLAMKGHR